MRRLLLSICLRDESTNFIEMYEQNVSVDGVGV
jgi:hypothetical protein